MFSFSLSFNKTDWYISYLYLKHPPLAFTQTQYGFYTGYRMLVACICTLVAVPIAKERFKISDSILYPIAIGSFAVDMLIMGLSSSSWMIWLGKYPLLIEKSNVT